MLDRLKKIKDKKKIKNIMNDYMLNKKEPPFLVTIFDKSKNLIYEGAKPISAVTDEETKKYTLSNMDSNYQRPVGQVDLNNIEYIQVY